MKTWKECRSPNRFGFSMRRSQAGFFGLSNGVSGAVFGVAMMRLCRSGCEPVFCRNLMHVIFSYQKKRYTVHDESEIKISTGGER